MSKLYLVVNEIFRPNSHVRTNRAGWHEQPNAWNVAERVSIVDGTLKQRVLAEASVIIDLVDSSVLKNRGSDDDKAIAAHYLEKYQEEVQQALLLWSLKDPRNMAKLRELSNGNETDSGQNPPS